MKFQQRSAFSAALAAVLLSIGMQTQAQELRVQCYSDGNECEVTGDIAKRFEAANAGIKIVIDKVPFKAVVEQLPVQLAAGEGPDIARVTELGGLNKYYLDLTPYLGAARVKYWQDNFASTLNWFRSADEKVSGKGIYGIMSQLTVTGAFVNKTLCRTGQGRHAPGHRDLGRMDGRRQESRRCHQDAGSPWPSIAADTASHRSPSLTAPRSSTPRASSSSTTATSSPPRNSSTGTRPA